MPCRKYSRAGRGVSPPPALLIFSLVALPPPAPGGGRAPSPLPPATRMCAGFRSHFRTKKKSTRKGCFSFWLRRWDFSLPCRKYSRAGRGVTPPPGSPYFLPCRAPSSRPRRRSHSGPTPSGNPDVRGVQVAFQSQREKHPQGVLFSLVAEVGFEPHDLRVMSPTSYQAALLRDILVPEAGVEPVRY